MLSDKQIEKERFNGRASTVLSENNIVKATLGSSVMSQFLRSPYQYYEKLIKERVSSADVVLELGAGSGLHTLCLVQTGARVVASDISPHSLEVLEKGIKESGYQVSTKVADIELLPFDNESFDVIACAGSLSYGDNDKVINEIFRVLKTGGLCICVDSLNHNPVYKFNRWIHFRRGNRTISTLKRMPTVSLTESYGRKFGSVHVAYFGAIAWLAPVLGIFLSDKKVSNLINSFDHKVSTKKSAFKFVMVVKKEIKAGNE